MHKIVILDGHVANPGDVDWGELSTLGDLTVYDRTPKELILERAKDATILLVNKCPLDRATISGLSELQYIGMLATGYNNIDVTAAKEKGVVVCNAIGYSAASVAQHVFALLLELTNQVGSHSQGVHQNEWANAQDWSYWKNPLMELKGKTMGIYGLGSIGTQVAKIALAFDMKVIATRKNISKPSLAGVTLVTEEILLQTSDVLTLHAPLTASNQEFINKESLSQMKPSAYLINTGRGGLVNEADLKKALQNGLIGGAGLDVLVNEPPELDHLLLEVPNCIITPHQAWATKESRQRLIAIAADNIKAFLNGKLQNCVY